MKKQLPAFLSGVVAAMLVSSLSIGALAATGKLIITVDSSIITT